MTSWSNNNLECDQVHICILVKLKYITLNNLKVFDSLRLTEYIFKTSLTKVFTTTNKKQSLLKPHVSKTNLKK